MDAHWRNFEFLLPSAMSRPDAASELRWRVLLLAADSGEFVKDVRITGQQSHAGDWKRWSVSYLTGPPKIGRPQREISLLRASH